MKLRFARGILKSNTRRKRSRPLLESSRPATIEHPGEDFLSGRTAQVLFPSVEAFPATLRRNA